MSEVVVSISKLGKMFGNHVALRQIEGQIHGGGVTGLVGPDGAGKTTLLRLIAGLLEASAGQVRTLGYDPVSEGAMLRLQLGYMPQKFGLYEDLSVAENLSLHADLRGVVGELRRETVKRLLDFAGLGPYTGRLAGKLSGGMKQKLGLACSLLGNPRLLLLDEPGVGVDPVSRHELRRMVGELVADGIAVIWSTSYLEEAESCETAWVLHGGELMYAGAPSGMTAPLAGRCWQLRCSAGHKRHLLAHALGHPSVSDGSVQGRDVRLTFKADATELPPQLDPVALGGEAGMAWVPVAPRFEDAFIDRMGGGPGGESVLAKHLRQIPADDQIVVDAQELTKCFGTFTAADHVSFQVKRGEIYGLLGPNGAGKSTTFKMLCGLLKPTSGRASVVGMDLGRFGGRARQRLGYMAQKFSLYGNLSVRQNLEFFSGIYGLAGDAQRQRTGLMAEIFHLAPFWDVAADSLSLGYKQRLALACAVTHEPDILFLDEPTSGVDPVTRREFWTHINGLVERGVTIIVTTHFMDEAEYCDRIGLIFQGRLLAHGSPDELKAAVASADLPEPSMEDAFIRWVGGPANP